MSKIIVKIAGFTSGMTNEQVVENASKIIEFYKPIVGSLHAFTWDGDPFKKKGSTRDQERNTSACFTLALIILKSAFPEVPFVAAKPINLVHQLSDEYEKTTKHGSVEVGCEDTFGKINIVSNFDEDSTLPLSTTQLNVVTAQAGIHWKELGCENVRFWDKLGFSVHYVTIGGGGIVKEELEKIGDLVDLIWRLETKRLSRDDDKEEIVPYFFSLK